MSSSVTQSDFGYSNLLLLIRVTRGKFTCRFEEAVQCREEGGLSPAQDRRGAERARGVKTKGWKAVCLFALGYLICRCRFLF
jgi:hypothetical protein